MRYCSSCLSSDRRLLLLRDLLEIAPIIKLLKINFNSDDYICWECEATFNRINTFRLQILKAQKTMKMAFKSKTRKKLKSLSKLCAIKKDSYDEFFTMDEDSKDGSANEDNSGDVEVDFIEDWHGFGYEETSEQFEEEDNTVFTAENEEEDTKPETTTDQEATEEALAYKVDPVMKLSKQEEQFLVTRMTLEEVHAARDQDRNAPVYKRCPYKCLTCVVGYYQEGKYEKHVGEKHDVNRLHQCAICEVRFTRQDSAEAHHDKHFRLYQCRLCGLSSHKLPVMLAHRASAHGQSVYACDQCDKEFDRPRSLWYHKKQHDEKPKCDICGKTASTKHNLKIHMTLHTGAKRVQCDECGRWVRATSLAAHRRTHGARDEAAYCAPCGLQCASAALYRRHLMRSRAHAPALPRFECSQCDSKYTDKYTLARHVAAKHLKIYPFKCHICNKGFIRKDRVQKHIRERHEGVTKPRDEMCVYCGKGFYERVSLKRHLRIHTGERPYSCRYCGASFGQSSTRNNHVRAIHKDEIELAA